MAHTAGTKDPRLTRRLRPLYASSFLQSFMLWYGIEKLFMRTIGFDDAQIAFAGILIAASMVVFQVPTGVLADRWSRRGMLMVASATLLLSTVVGALSSSPQLYYVTSALWGLFAAIRIGIYDTIVYDVLQEERSSAEGFEHFFGRFQLVNGAAFATSSLLSGLSAQTLGLRETYWISLPLGCLSLLALARFREPEVHKRSTVSSVWAHTALTVQSVIRGGTVLWLVVPAVLFAVVSRMMSTLPQLWYLALAMPVIFWGPAYAASEFGDAFSGPLAAVLRGRRLCVLITALLTVAASVALAFETSPILIVIAQMFLLAGSGVFQVLLSRHLHDSFPSAIRAGASSAVGTLAMLVFLPITYVFGVVSSQYSVFRGAWVVVAVTTASTIAFCIRILRTGGRIGAEAGSSAGALAADG
jgi:MFS family permease